MRLHSHNITELPSQIVVVVAMSGGVDSSVVAGLLAQKDYDLSAIFMRNWDTRDESGTDNGCEWKKDYADVLRVCKVLDIPCKLVRPLPQTRLTCVEWPPSRLTSPASIGCVCLSRLSPLGSWVAPRTQMYGAISEFGCLCQVQSGLMDFIQGRLNSAHLWNT